MPDQAGSPGAPHSPFQSGGGPHESLHCRPAQQIPKGFGQVGGLGKQTGRKGTVEVEKGDLRQGGRQKRPVRAAGAQRQVAAPLQCAQQRQGQDEVAQSPENESNLAITGHGELFPGFVFAGTGAHADVM